MKHKEIIRHLLDNPDAKIQYISARAAPPVGWVTWAGNAHTAMRWLLDPNGGEKEEFKVRLQPEPVPDKVITGILWVPPVKNWADDQHIRNIVNQTYYKAVVRLTIKTDDNGIETKHIELI